MSVKKRVAINGFGRIGRAVFRNYCRRIADLTDVANKADQGKHAADELPFEIVAINDVEGGDILSHLLQYDSTYGVAEGYVAEQLKEVCFLQQPTMSVSETASDNSRTLWRDHSVDIVLECSGSYRHRARLVQHLEAGAKKVLLGAPAYDPLDRMVVYGVNHQTLQQRDQLISNASCTTNALAVALHLLLSQFKITQVWATEIHGYTTDQNLLDHAHRDPRRARSAAENMIPTQTMGLEIIDQILPELEGAVCGYSMRVPLPVGACLDVTLRIDQSSDNNTTRCLTAEQINELFQAHQSDWLGYSDAPLVSSDFIARRESAIFDATQTKVKGDMVKLMLWFDNEWGYSNRLLDVLSLISKNHQHGLR